jgi:high-affinity nickel-transport protein
MPDLSSRLSFRARLVLIYAVLMAANALAWAWALLCFHGQPVMLGIAALIYGLGLRHAVDADHIAAIDNVTRKLVQSGTHAVSVGFYFALGHSLVVTIVAAAIAGAATSLDRIQSFKQVGSLLSTCFSALFLVAIAAINLGILYRTVRTYRALRSGRIDDAGTTTVSSSGLLATLVRPAFALVTKSWHMLLLGFMFGLSFDTATEIAMFSASATQAEKGISFWAILSFPALFAAAMSLVDTTDGVMMLGAYCWALVNPTRKLYYNMSITVVSVLVALLIAGVEALNAIGDGVYLPAEFWHAVGAVSEHFNQLGFAIVAMFFLAWLISYFLSRMERGTEAPSDALSGG